MPKNIESYSLKQDMREDLMQCYREVAPNCITQFGAWRKTVQHPAKRYYIAPECASQLFSKYFHGDKHIFERMKPTHRKMYYALLKEVEQLMASPEHHNDCLLEICRIAVARPAPQFFLTPQYMAVLFSRIKHNKYNKDGQLKSDVIKQLKKKNENGTEH